MKLYVIDHAQLEALARLSRRLHTEERMNGDDMRNAGHELEAVVRVCRELELPPETLKGFTVEGSDT